MKDLLEHLIDEYEIEPIKEQGCCSDKYKKLKG